MGGFRVTIGGRCPPEPPGIYRIVAKAEELRKEETPRFLGVPSASATGTALRLRPRRAVSSAQYIVQN